MGHARALLPVEDPEVELALYEQILADGLSVRNVEEIVRGGVDAAALEQARKEKPAQRKPKLPEEFNLLKDHLSSFFNTTVKAVLSAADSLPQPKVKLKEFKPDPNKALLYALVPGLGQIYNRKYWKLPLVYGAFMGCMYAITWNNKNYKDYSTAYFDIMEDYQKVLAAEKDGQKYEGPWQESWTIFVRNGEESTYVSNAQFQENLKRRKDYFRRYRDLSIIITVGVYAISIIDAYVDAQLFDFDISPDLSLHWSPEVTPKTRYTPGSYGLNCSFKF